MTDPNRERDEPVGGQHPTAEGVRNDVGASSSDRPTAAVEGWLNADKDPMDGASDASIVGWKAGLTPSGQPGRQNEEDRGGAASLSPLMNRDEYTPNRVGGAAQEEGS
jgi:hypothetical protein